MIACKSEDGAENFGGLNIFIGFYFFWTYCRTATLDLVIISQIV